MAHGHNIISPGPSLPLWKWPRGKILFAQVQVYHSGSDPWAKICWPRSKFTTLKMTHGLRYIGPGPSLPLWKWPKGTILFAQVQVYHSGSDPWAKIYWPKSMYTTMEMAHGLNFIGPGPSLPLWKWPMGTILLSQVQVYHFGNGPWAQFYCPRSKFTTMEVTHGPRFIGPGPSLPPWK